MVWIWKWGRERNQGQLLGVLMSHGVDGILFIETRRTGKAAKGRPSRVVLWPCAAGDDY